ncbi:MAG: hypothetical protein AAFV85_27050 [Cyanobacteria bacterium J06634_6]
MVFATDFDPTQASARRKSAQSASRVTVSPVHQTNRLLAQAAQSQEISKRAIAQKRALEKVAEAKANLASQNNVSDVATRVQMTSVAATEIATLPLKAKPSLPLWLQVLDKVQQGSTAVASLLIAGALVLYGSSVYADKSTDRALTHLNRLQSESQQLTAANEAMKQSLAEQAMEENSGLEPYEAGDVLFVTPAPLRPAKAPVESSKKERIRPLGY